MVRLITLLTIAAATASGANGARAADTETRYLSGTDKDNTVQWEFMVTGGRRSGVWSKIPVPSQWEQFGFGNYNYGHDQTRRTPNKIRHKEQGLYRHRFTVPAAWRERKVRLVFEGAMTDTEVKLNGQSAGPVHQGGFYRFSYDVTGLLRHGQENLLEVTVSKHSANESVNKAEREADFWVFGGIYRPVYLEALPKEHIDRIAIDARHDGAIAFDAFLSPLPRKGRLVALVRTDRGERVGSTFIAPVAPGQERVTLKGHVRSARAWTPEFPHLHRVELRLEQGGRLVHRVEQTFGFRTVELRPNDGLYVNGVKVRLKGVNRHSFWPDSGRTTSPAISEADVNLIKDMNMNAVRMSHYPPDQHFLETADRLGLFVVDELTGWQDAYDTEVGRKLVRELVTRDVNHPSIVFWTNGNEGGYNHDLVGDYARWDPQRRVVLHPWSNFNAVDTAHYETPSCCAGMFFGGDDVLMPTEFLHGLYDGGHGAGLSDWWARIWNHPTAVGGFLWVLADEGIKRTDRGGMLDTDGDHAADGIVGPYREKEGSFFAIKEIWSPVHLEAGTMDRLPPTFDGSLRVENRYHFTNLAQVRFRWELRRFPEPGPGRHGHAVHARGTVPFPSVAPSGVGTLRVPLPPDWRSSDALALTATDPHGREIWTWTWMISTPESLAERLVRDGQGVVEARESAGRLVVRHARGQTEFDLKTGHLASVQSDGRVFSLRNGPRLVHGQGALQRITHERDGDAVVVDARYDGGFQARWRLRPGGWLTLSYEFPVAKGEYDALGVTFDLPENEVKGMTWLGRGPYRVWKNRRRGVGFDVWQKAYNDTVTGETWVYPEFKGFHGDLYWARVDTASGPVTVVSGTRNVDLRMLTPRFPAVASHTKVAFPAGDLSFLHAIPPIGTKFRKPADHGPEGQPNVVYRHGAKYQGTIHLRFGESHRPE